jgi:hypothetical protein
MLKNTLLKREINGPIYNHDFEKLSEAKLKIIDTFTSCIDGLYKTTLYIEVDNREIVDELVAEMKSEWLIFEDKRYEIPTTRRKPK